MAPRSVFTVTLSDFSRKSGLTVNTPCSSGRQTAISSVSGASSWRSAGRLPALNFSQSSSSSRPRCSMSKSRSSYSKNIISSSIGSGGSGFFIELGIAGHPTGVKPRAKTEAYVQDIRIERRLC
jgi:hypothetical protein